MKRAAGIAAGLGTAAPPVCLPAAAASGAVAIGSAMSIEAVGEAIKVSSLRGTAADGDWGIDASGRFCPNREVRPELLGIEVAQVF